ncbi:MAG: hypothetical protein LBC89_03365 [Bacteroidales bacterium]|nr:hypothetical protein [Bacteroidales bacterium]
METTAEKSYRSSTLSVLWKANSSRTINVGTDQSGMYMDMVEEGNKVCPLECFSEMG